eukprot:TRINITY_DN1868_c4_g1_i1.p1 TRINITY_DN1868_c4_g1~~TRINITY_DN1868_c4_g1_i1.p1  ORF type:complete len:491 (+),score=99.05 TRINITY_DN1868_c4_g1_i1:28-1473(+)
MARCSFGQPLELPADEPLWPARDDQQPQVVHTVEAFMEIVLFETHLDRIVILPNGVKLMEQEHGIPEEVASACRGSTSMREFISALSPELKAKFKGRLWHYAKKDAEKEIRKSGKKKCLADVEGVLRAQQADGTVPMTAPLYLSELRWVEKVKHCITGEMVKTATRVDVYDHTPLSARMPLWERSEGGIFIGERGAGSGMHVDQCLWSNVGRNWCGHKLLAMWPWTERHKIMDEASKGTVFHLPLTDETRGFLARARTIARVGPGDMWVFSGGQPHTAMCVGDGLNISAYESFLPANAEAMDTLVRTNTPSAHCKGCWMDDEDLDELYEDIVDRIQEARRALATVRENEDPVQGRLRSRLEACKEVMRDRGDSYCQELWDQEDKGERRRRREEEDAEDERERAKKVEAGGVDRRSRSRSRSGSWSGSCSRSRSYSYSDEAPESVDRVRGGGDENTVPPIKRPRAACDRDNIGRADGSFAVT